MSYIENQSPSSTVSVGGTPVTNPNFSSTTPAAPPGDVNVTWQVSGSNISGYVPLSTSTPAPPSQSIQFNNAGAFGGSPEFFWDNANSRLFLANGTGGDASWQTDVGPFMLNIQREGATSSPAFGLLSATGSASRVVLGSAGGTLAAPDFVSTGQGLGEIDFAGYDSADAGYVPIFILGAEAAGDWDVSHVWPANLFLDSQVVGRILKTDELGNFQINGTLLVIDPNAATDSSAFNVTVGAGGFFYQSYNGSFSYQDVNFATSASDILLQCGSGGIAFITTGSISLQGTSTVTNILNATAGFQYNGAAPLGHVLVGNGTNYVDSALPPSPAGGSPTQIQFNNGGVLGGIPGSVVDGVNGLVTLAPTGSGVALTLVGDADSSDILDLSAIGAGFGVQFVVAGGGSSVEIHITDPNSGNTNFLNGTGYIITDGSDANTYTATSASLIALHTDSQTLQLTPSHLSYKGDAGISRLGAASLAIGNGTDGDFSGSLKLTGLSVQGALTDGSASVGSAGQVLTSTGTKVAWAAAGGGVSNVVTKSSAYLAVAGDFVLCDTSGGGFSVTLPLSASNKGSTITVKKVSSDTNVLTIARSGADTIDGQTTQTTAIPETSVEMIADGTTTWEIY